MAAALLLAYVRVSRDLRSSTEGVYGVGWDGGLQQIELSELAGHLNSNPGI